MDSIHALSWFQVENLLLNNVNFLLLDLRVKKSRQDEPINFFKKALSVDESEVLTKVRELLPHVAHPVLLICDNGKQSALKAEELNSMGFLNVYFFLGGYEVLKQEAL
ncbi:MAG: hypothetical protein K1X29_00095 [Bdellovibrionales bacterium]|nr:hypothetical protein [Bdellovibrionales bacterium]